jgi:hypothetical protein
VRQQGSRITRDYVHGVQRNVKRSSPVPRSVTLPARCAASSSNSGSARNAGLALRSGSSAAFAHEDSARRRSFDFEACQGNSSSDRATDQKSDSCRNIEQPLGEQRLRRNRIVSHQQYIAVPRGRER